MNSLLISFDTSSLMYTASLLEGMAREVVLDEAIGSRSTSGATGVAVLVGIELGFALLGVVLGVLEVGL